MLCAWTRSQRGSLTVGRLRPQGPASVGVDGVERDADARHMESTDRPSADLLAALVSEVHGVLGDDLVGLYLYGSAVTGGFDAGVSDLDLAAVTAHEVEAIDLTGLERMHDRFAEQNPEWRGRVEVVYIGRATLG